jgi:hypothetical protein
VSSARLRSALVTVAGLAVLVWMNYYLRHTLEDADARLFSFYKYFYPAQEKIVFSPATPWWKLLLPIPAFTGTWNTTTLVLMRLLENYIRPATGWYVFNAILIVVSFWSSWMVFRSRVFSFTLAICMGFGTQLYIAYPNSGPISFPLLFAYYQLLLLSAYKLIVTEERRGPWVALFAVALPATVLAYEGWLDLLVFVWLAAAYLFVMFGRMGLERQRRRLVVVTAVISCAGVAYIVTKILVGYGQTPGMESDVVMNYPSLAPAVEDVVSNVFTNFYMAVTNFLPPSLVSSTAFYQLGGDRLVELQHGYHAPFSYLVPMHYLFTWRYFAGVAATVYVIVLARLLRRCWNAPTAERIALILFLLLMAVAGPTHDMIKFRPMNAMPVQTYHVLTGVLGAALVISWLLMRAWARWPRWTGGAIVAFGWVVIFYGALARPGLIAHQAAQSGIGVQAYPNPMAALMIKWGRPYPIPGGLAVYQLMKYSPSPAQDPASGGGPLPAPTTRRFESVAAPLPQAAPPLTQWAHAPAVSVTAEGERFVVVGDSTPMGYQLTSPPLPVTPHTTLLIRVNGTIEQGQVCVGALDESQVRWVAPADAPRSELALDTGGNHSVTIVFANCMPVTEAAPRTRFTLESVTYGTLGAAGGNR